MKIYMNFDERKETEKALESYRTLSEYPLLIWKINKKDCHKKIRDCSVMVAPLVWVQVMGVQIFPVPFKFAVVV